MFFFSTTHVGNLLDGLIRVTELEDKTLMGTNLTSDFSSFDFVFEPEIYLKLERCEKPFKYLVTESK